jgi:chromosomal replication initiation ATPase DnaA
MFADTDAAARQEYARFMQADIQESVLRRLRHGSNDDDRILTDDGFGFAFTAMTASPLQTLTLEDVIQQVCRKHNVPVDALSSMSRQRIYSQVRAEIGLAAIEGGIATNAEIARRFNRSQSSLSRAIDQLRRQRKYANK